MFGSRWYLIWVLTTQFRAPTEIPWKYNLSRRPRGRLGEGEGGQFRPTEHKDVSLSCVILCQLNLIDQVRCGEKIRSVDYADLIWQGNKVARATPLGWHIGVV